MEAFDVAVASGADAVYLGLDNFNARMKAQNFDCDNIAQVVSRAHFYGVKVYVTINTILQNCEFKELIELVKASIDAKVDAFWCKTSECAKCSKKLLTAYVCTQAHSWECTIFTARKLPKKRVFQEWCCQERQNSQT